MKFMQILLLVAVSACAVASVEEVPTYHKYVQDYNQSKKIVLDLSTPPVNKDGPIWDLPSRKRDYIQLVGFIHDMTHRIYLQKNYDDDYYKVLNSSVPKSWTNPQHVLDNLDAFINYADGHTQQVRDLVDQYCGTYRRTNVDCDLLVDLEIKKDPKKYKREAEALVALGKLSALYVKEPYGPKAHDFDMISFLLTGKSELKELIKLVHDAKYAMRPLPPKVNVR